MVVTSWGARGAGASVMRGAAAMRARAGDFLRSLARDAAMRAIAERSGRAGGGGGAGAGAGDGEGAGDGGGAGAGRCASARVETRGASRTRRSAVRFTIAG